MKNNIQALSSTLRIAETAYKQLINETPWLLAPSFYRSNIDIKSALVNHQAFNDFSGSINSSDSLTSQIDKRQGGFVLTILHGSEIIIDFAKVTRLNPLPRSKYRLHRAATANNPSDKLSLFADENKLQSAKSYGILAYTWNGLSIDYANLIFPDCNIKKAESYIEIPLLKLSDTSKSESVEYERKVSNLKKHIKKTVMEKAN